MLLVIKLVCVLPTAKFSCCCCCCSRCRCCRCRRFCSLSCFLIRSFRQTLSLFAGTGPNEFIGNVRFRALVHQVLMRSCGTGDSFDTTATTSSCSSSRRTRTETTSTVSSPPAPANTSFSSIHARTGSKRVPLARQVVEMIKSRGGRFLERLRGEDSRYREVDDSIAIEKAKQSFRHQIRSTPAGQGQHRVRTTSSLHQNNKKRKRMADDEGAASASTANSRRASKYSRPVAQQTARGASSSVAAAFHNETTKILDQTAAVSPSTIATLVSRPLQLVVQPDGGNHRSTMILSPQVIQSLLRRGGGGQQEERIQQIRPMLLPPEVLEQEEAILRRASIAAALSREYSTLAGPPPGLLYPRELVYGAPLWNVADIISPLYDPFTAARWEARQRYLSREAMLLQANCNPLLSPLDEQALALALQQSPPR